MVEIRKNTNSYYVPNCRRTLYDFEFSGPSGNSMTVKVERIGSRFYRLENGDNKVLIAEGFKELIRYLYKAGGRFKVMKKSKRKFSTPALFLQKADALHLLRLGFSVYHLESNQILTFDENYDSIVSSAGTMFNETNLAPGNYTVAWLEEKKVSLSEVLAERTRRKAEAERAAKAAEKAAARQKDENTIRLNTKEIPANIEPTPLQPANQDVQQTSKVGNGGKKILVLAAGIIGLTALGSIFAKKILKNNVDTSLNYINNSNSVYYYGN